MHSRFCSDTWGITTQGLGLSGPLQSGQGAFDLLATRSVIRQD